MSCTITATEFKAYFDRGDFVYGAVLPAIRDSDIDKAIAEAQAIFNDGLYPTEALCKQALYYLTAHFLLLDTSAASGGGQAIYNQTSRSADGLSESVSIPEWMNEGELAFYSTTYYGQKWLMLSKPYLDGAVFTVSGATQP
jgi:hypothetical protein